MPVKPSFARLSPLAKGRIVGMREEGAERADIATRVMKKDGTFPSLKAIDNVLHRFEEDSEWDGKEERAAPPFFVGHSGNSYSDC